MTTFFGDLDFLTPPVIVTLTQLTIAIVCFWPTFPLRSVRISSMDGSLGELRYGCIARRKAFNSLPDRMLESCHAVSLLVEEVISTLFEIILF